MVSKFVVTFVSFFVLASAIQAASLNAVRKSRHAIGSKAEAYSAAKEFKAALKAGDDSAFADGVTASAVLAKLGNKLPTAKNGWHIDKTSKVIPAAEMSGSQPDGSGLGSAEQSVEAGEWVLTNAPEDPKGGEHVTTVKLSCWNVFSHSVPTEQVAVRTRHHRRVLHEGNTIEETTTVIPGRTIRTQRTVQGPDRYEAPAAYPRQVTQPVVQMLMDRGYSQNLAVVTAQEIVRSNPAAYQGGGYIGGFHGAPQSNRGGDVNITAFAGGGNNGGYFRALEQQAPPPPPIPFPRNGGAGPGGMIGNPPPVVVQPPPMLNPFPRNGGAGPGGAIR